MSVHPLSLAGWILLIAGLALYLAVIIGAVFRVSRQYSRAMAGMAGLGLNAAFAAAGRNWFLLIPIVLGAILLVAGR